MRKAFTMVIAVLLFSTLVFGQTTSLNLTWNWSAPTTGSAVHHYVVQSSSNATTWTTLTTQPTTNSVTLSCPVGVNIQIRVAGVDAQGRQGPWSEASDPFVPDAGAPGAAGKPIRVP